MTLTSISQIDTRQKRFLPQASISIFIALILSNPLHALADQTPPQVRKEIEALFKSLHSANCQFNRNGSWYNSTEAQAHLTKKLAHFEKRSMINTTEDFIQLAASSSSTSGKAYQVKCGNDAAVESNSWLSNQLKMLRARK